MARECENCVYNSDLKAVECGSCMVTYYDGLQRGLPSNFKPKPMTNADRIRSMTDEELAVWLEWEYGKAKWCDPDRIGTEDCSDIDCTGCIAYWLKQPYEDAEPGV